ncbi:MAG: hypothetical protein HQL69_05565 [Magnetococcales bacterium]|nr:hypothetical protein [Magnetococcales bacterium]
MAIKRVVDVDPGMVLASDAMDMSGRMLLAAGKEITAKHLKIFRTWGVPEVDIKEDSPSGADGDAESSSRSDGEDKFEVKAKALFCQNDLNDPLIKELFKFCVSQMKKNPSLIKVTTEEPVKKARRALPKSSQGRMSRHGRR